MERSLKMKKIQVDSLKLISAGTLKNTPSSKNGALDPQQMLFPEKNTADFFSKWISY